MKPIYEENEETLEIADRWTSLRSICSEIKNVFRRKYP